MKEYFTKYGFKNATLSDFIAELQKHFKHEGLNLEQWRNYWLKKASLNQLEPIWNPDSNSEQEILQVIQTPVA